MPGTHLAIGSYPESYQEPQINKKIKNSIFKKSAEDIKLKYFIKDHKRSCANDQSTHDKVFNIIRYQKSKLNHSVISLHSHPNG